MSRTSSSSVLAKPLIGLLVLDFAIAKSGENGYVEVGGDDISGHVIETSNVPDDASRLTGA